MSKFDVAPIWDFRGLEDARFVKWEGEYYLVGVRRDTTTNGEGRMEYSKIDISDPNNVKEISRVRMETPEPGSYCEKNWMPILDKPFHFIRWSNPIHVVRSNPENGSCQLLHVGNYMNVERELRGSSHVIPFKDGYLYITHEVGVWFEPGNRKNGHYKHRFFYVNKDWSINRYTTPFSFMGAMVEFCTGMAEYGDDLLISFGFTDDAAYILRCPKKLVEGALYA